MLLNSRLPIRVTTDRQQADGVAGEQDAVGAVASGEAVVVGGGSTSFAQATVLEIETGVAPPS